jgi:hypothetical protein
MPREDEGVDIVELEKLFLLLKSWGQVEALE